MATKYWRRQKNTHRQNFWRWQKYTRRQNYWRQQKYVRRQKYTLQQNYCVDKISKYTRRQNMGVNKILGRQKLGVDKKLAQTERWCRRRRISFLLGSAESAACLPLPCFSGRTLSRTVPAYCTGPPCWKCPKLWRWQNIGVRLKFPDFCLTIAV